MLYLINMPSANIPAILNSGTFMNETFNYKNEWRSSPLKSLPNPTDQTVYLNLVYILLIIVAIALLSLGIWYIYKGVRNKEGSEKALGALAIVAAAVLRAFQVEYGQISSYVTSLAYNGLNAFQRVEVDLASLLYSIFGSTVSNNTRVVLTIAVLCLAVAVPIALIVSIVKDSRSRRKALVAGFEERIKMLEDEAKANAAALEKLTSADLESDDNEIDIEEEQDEIEREEALAKAKELATRAVAQARQACTEMENASPDEAEEALARVNEALELAKRAAAMVEIIEGSEDSND